MCAPFAETRGSVGWGRDRNGTSRPPTTRRHVLPWSHVLPTNVVPPPLTTRERGVGMVRPSTWSTPWRHHGMSGRGPIESAAVVVGAVLVGRSADVSVRWSEPQPVAPSSTTTETATDFHTPRRRRYGADCCG